MKIRNIIITLVSAIALLISASTVSFAKVVGDKIILGAAVSLTGKYRWNNNKRTSKFKKNNRY
jgi:branched-chain amino acid transport system substrate-binding protein